jgi:hypothetical protein
MPQYAEARPAGILIGRLDHGADLLEQLNAVCNRENVRLGRVEAIGAVRKARLGFYNQQNREYEFLTFDRPMEITKLAGNVSLKDGKPFVHAHVTLADENGAACGGHLAEGTEVFACEFVVHPYEGAELSRAYDEPTGLPLWDMD